MEYVKCENCQCWDEERGYIETKRDDWGLCTRRAPNSVYSMPKTSMYLFAVPFTKKIRSLRILKDNISFTSNFSGMPKNAGCWEGIPKT